METVPESLRLTGEFSLQGRVGSDPIGLDDAMSCDACTDSDPSANQQKFWEACEADADSRQFKKWFLCDACAAKIIDRGFMPDEWKQRRFAIH